MAAELTRQAASRLHGAASWLDSREPADLLEEVRSFARRRPGAFLLAAAATGLAAGRLTRGLAAGSDGAAGSNGSAGGNGGPGGGRARDAWRPAAAAERDYPAASYAAGVADPASAAANLDGPYPDSPGTYPAGAGGYPAEPAGYPADPADPAETPAYPADLAETAAYPADTIAYPAEPATRPNGVADPANPPSRPGQAPSDEGAQW
jgi:hypothetical protein